MNKELEKCLEAVRAITKDKNFNEEELQHRARLLWFINRLSFWEELPILLDIIMYERTRESKE